MKTTNCIPALLLLLAFTACSPDKNDLAHYVNPFIGTDYTGNTYPGAQVPFGMVQLSPDNGHTGWDHIAGYFYPDSVINGFSHTHLSGTGAGDLYDIPYFPVTMPYKKAEPPLGIYSRFSHQDETASPGYYQVRLLTYDINVELTATEHCGIQRYTFPKGKSAIILDLHREMNWDTTTDSYIEIVDSTTIRGYRYSDGWARKQRIYFVTRFSRPFFIIHQDAWAIVKKDSAIGDYFVGRFEFETKRGEQITLSTSISATGPEGAELNLKTEVPDDDFDKYRAAARNKWNKELGQFTVEGDNEDDKVNFYTALYHSMLAPTLYNDADYTYNGADGKVHEGEKWNNYSTFSLWDTYRAAHPLFTLTQPERTADMVKSLLAFYDQSGRLPVWNLQGSESDMMIGYHSVAVIADAYLKGITGFDPEKALAACVASANIDSYRGIGEYKRLGYVPANQHDSFNKEGWSLSKTLEYAFDDYCIARMAERMGRTDIAAQFDQRALNYRNLYNPATGFMQPRDDKGQFLPGFKAEAYTEHICESNGWQYLWSVQHDPKGLRQLMGGNKRFLQKLDSMFTYHPGKEDKLPLFSTGMIGQYAHGNEPSHHVIYLYNLAHHPWKTQKYVAQVMHNLYRNTPAGLCGNEDCGQMSAWYVFNAMGFYPANPVSGRYEIGTPLFRKLQLKLPNGKTLTVLAPEVSRKNIYIQRVRVNGKPYTKSYLTHEMITGGATIEFDMGSKPAITFDKE